MTSEPTETTDAMRDLAFRLNDTVLNREKVSVNQIRQILRAALLPAERPTDE